VTNTRCLVFNRESLRRIHECRGGEDEKGGLQELIFWGGDFLNVEEDLASRFVDSNSSDLQKLTYFPKRTKGGAMIRPKYHEGDRGTKVLFPKLESISICVHTWVDNLYAYGYDAPNLKHIELLVDPEMPSSSRFDGWQHISRAPKKSLRHYPLLKDITVMIASQSDATRQKQIWAKLHSPEYVSWSVVRVLFIGALKESPEECHLARIPIELVSMIAKFLFVDWRIESFPIQLPETLQSIRETYFVR